MAGNTDPNKPVLVRSSTRTQRIVENPVKPQQPNQWTTGVNDGGGNNAGLGINTGDYDPKAQDWNRATRATQPARYIGAGDTTRAGRDDWPPTNNPFPAAGENVTAFLSASDLNDPVMFIQANAQVAIGGNVTDGTNTGVNRTGKIVPSGSWVFVTNTTASAAALDASVVEDDGTGQVDPARVGIAGSGEDGNQVRIVYCVDEGPDREVVYDVVGPQTEAQIAMGVAALFSDDTEVAAEMLTSPINHVAIWPVSGGTVYIKSVSP